MKSRYTKDGRPRKRVICSKCGWAGYRMRVGRHCPKCNHWYPEVDYKYTRKRMIQ